MDALAGRGVESEPFQEVSTHRSFFVGFDAVLLVADVDALEKRIEVEQDLGRFAMGDGNAVTREIGLPTRLRGRTNGGRGVTACAS